MGAAKQYRRGLVVGKFCPLHRGHMRLIDSALDACDEVVVISYTKPEFDGCGSDARRAWIAALFPQVRALVLDDEVLAAVCAAADIAPLSRIPPNDAPEAIHRDFTGWLCWTVMGVAVDAVFTSEAYGDGFARALSAYFASRSPDAATVRHVCLDIARAAVPISGTAIRADPYAQRRYLDPLVYASLVKRVCIIGAESSGKTSLAQSLAARLDTAWAPEFGRELWEHKGGALTFDDMLLIAQVQAARELTLSQQAKQWLVCDTGALVTCFYSLDLFGAIDPALALLADQPYAATFLCAPDFPFVQDGTRRGDAFRQRQHEWYVAALNERGVAYTVLQGTLESRLSLAHERLKSAPIGPPALANGAESCAAATGGEPR